MSTITKSYIPHFASFPSANADLQCIVKKQFKNVKNNLACIKKSRLDVGLKHIKLSVASLILYKKLPHKCFCKKITKKKLL